MTESGEAENGGQLPVGYIVADRYEIERCLGAGGMGAVYLARDVVLGDERVAIKILHAELVANQRQTQRFLREVQLMRRVNNRNVVRTFDVGTDGSGVVYFTMEFVPGRPLEEFIQEGSYPRANLEKLIIQICEGLEAIHKANIIHRDLKPANILVLKDGTIKITDFGVARPEYSELTAHNEILGSALYIAPEIWLGTKMTNAVDLYSVGVMLYELLTGTLPFDGDSPAALMRMHLEYEPTPPKDLNESIPLWLNKLILKLLAKSAIDRPRDAREVIEYVKLHSDSGARIDAKKGAGRSGEDSFIDQIERLTSESMPHLTAVEQEQTAAAGKAQKPDSLTRLKQRKATAITVREEARWSSFGAEMLARGVCLSIAALLLAGAWAVFFWLSSVAAPALQKIDILAVASGGFPDPNPFASAAPVLLFSLLRWLALFAGSALLAALIGAFAGSMTVVIKIVVRIFLVQWAVSLLLFVYHLWPALRHGTALINGLSLYSAASAAGENLRQIVMLDPIAVGFRQMILEQGMLLIPETKGGMWSSPLVAVLMLVYLLVIGWCVHSSLKGGKVDPYWGFFTATGGAVAVLAAAPAVVPGARLAIASGAKDPSIWAANFPEAVAVSWIFIYLMVFLLSLAGGKKRSRT